jgi:hypothetical protein
VLSVKGQFHKIFCFRCFHLTTFPAPTVIDKSGKDFVFFSIFIESSVFVDDSRCVRWWGSLIAFLRLGFLSLKIDHKSLGGKAIHCLLCELLYL